MERETQDLSEAVDAASQLASECGRQDLAAALRGLGERYRARELFVVLVGQTSVGKTTLVNTVLGEPLLPATPGATTGVPVELRFHRGERRFERIDERGEVTLIDREELRRLVVEPGSVHRLRVFWPVNEAAVGLANAVELDGLVLVDAPGYDSLEQAHQEVLLDIIPQADAVVFMVDYRAGVTAEDAKMLRLVGDFVDSPPAIHCAVNRVPEAPRERKRAVMESQLSEIAQAPMELHELTREPATAGHEVRIWSRALWSKLVAIAQDPARASVVEANTRALLLTGLAQLDEALRQRVTRLECRRQDGVDPLLRELEAARAARQRAHAILDEAATRMADDVCAEVTRGRDRLYARACELIDDASRVWDADSCTAMVREHVVPVEVERTRNGLSRGLNAHGRRLVDELETVVAGLDSVTRLRPRVAEVPYEDVRDQGAKGLVGKAAAGIFQQKLRRMGGAAGSEAGFVNLAKRVVSKTGRAFGKRFDRAVYDNMGRVLRRVGLSSARATAIVAVVVIEVATWLYRVARWKQKLRGVLQHTLDLEAKDEPLEDELMRLLPWRSKASEKPLVHVRVDTIDAVGEAVDAVRADVDETLQREESMLADVAGTRAQDIDRELERAAGWLARVHDLFAFTHTEETSHVQA